MTDTKGTLKTTGVGDCWRATVQQWNRFVEVESRDGIAFHGGGDMPDAVGYIIAPCAADAAMIAEAAYTTKSGPMTRVRSVEYVGPAWMEQR